MRTIALLPIIAGLLLAGAAGHPTPLALCPTEDSTNCYWDADTMGNGHGRSFTVDPFGNVTYKD